MTANVSTLTLHRSSTRKVAGESYLKFQLIPGMTAVLAMRQIQEVRILPSQRLTPMPNMPVSVLGLMNHRSRVRWVLDIAQLLGLPPLDPNPQQYELLLLRVNDIALGLAVRRIETTVWLANNTIQPPADDLSPILKPYLQGCVLHEQAISLVFDADAIARLSMTLCE